MTCCAWCGLDVHAAGKRLTGGTAAVQRGRWLYGRQVTEGRRRAAATLPRKGPGPGDSLRGDSGFFVAWLLDNTRGLDAARAHTEYRSRAYGTEGVDVERFGRFPHLAVSLW